jgi:hypothetical protein
VSNRGWFSRSHDELHSKEIYEAICKCERSIWNYSNLSATSNAAKFASGSDCSDHSSLVVEHPRTAAYIAPVFQPPPVIPPAPSMEPASNLDIPLAPNGDEGR